MGQQWQPCSAALRAAPQRTLPSFAPQPARPRGQALAPPHPPHPHTPTHQPPTPPHPPCSCFLAVYISSVAFLYEFLAWNQWAPIYVTATGRPSSILRY